MKTTLILIFLFTYSICFSQDFWEPYPIPNDVPLNGFAADSNGNLYACNYGFYVSSDKGQTWQSRGKLYLNDKLVTFHETKMQLHHLAIDEDGYMYMIQGYNTLLFSSDKGETWSMKDIKINLSGRPIDGIKCYRKAIFVYSKDHSIYDISSIFGISEDHGTSWVQPVMRKKKIRWIDINSNNEAWAATTEGFFKITKEYNGWMLNNNDIVDSLVLDKFIYYKDYIIASSAKSDWPAPPTKINYSSDYGKTWNIIEDLGSDVTSLTTDGESIYIGTKDGNLIRGDGINSFHLVTTFPGRGAIDAIYAKDGDLYVAADGLYYSSDNGTIWSKRNSGITNGLFRDIVFDNEHQSYVLTTRSLYTKSQNDSEWKLDEVFLFEDGDWKNQNTALICADSLGDIYLSSNNGFCVTRNDKKKWDTLSGSSTEPGDLLSTKKTIIINTQHPRLMTGYIFTYDFSVSGFFKIKKISSGMFHTAINNDDVIGILDSSRYYETSDYCYNWSIREFLEPYDNFNPHSLAMLNNVLFISDRTKAYKALNKDTIWTQIYWDKSDANDNYSMMIMKRIGSHIFALTNHGIFIYDESTNSLKDYNFNVAPSYVTGISQDKKGFLYMSCLSGTFKSTSPVTSIKETQETPGRDYVYPNPASINCTLFLSGLSIGSEFGVKVYNSIGTEVLDLGNHIVESFDMKLDINTELLCPGAYFACFEQKGMRQTIPFTVAR